MKHDSLHQQAIREITEHLISTGNMDGTLENCPGMKERVARLIALLRSAMYPHIFGTSSRRGSAASAIAVSYNLQSAAELLEQILTTLQPERTEEETDTLILRFLEQIPEIKACLETDIQAAYDGDPAAMTQIAVVVGGSVIAGHPAKAGYNGVLRQSVVRASPYQLKAGKRNKDMSFKSGGDGNI